MGQPLLHTRRLRVMVDVRHVCRHVCRPIGAGSPEHSEGSEDGTEVEAATDARLTGALAAGATVGADMAAEPLPIEVRGARLRAPRRWSGLRGAADDTAPLCPIG